MTTDFVDRMAALRERFAARCVTRRDDLSLAIATDDRAGMARIAHELAGNAGIFGFAELSQLAHDLEDAARSGNRARSVLRERGETLLQALAELASEPGG